MYISFFRYFQVNFRTVPVSEIDGPLCSKGEGYKQTRNRVRCSFISERLEATDGHRSLRPQIVDGSRDNAKQFWRV